MSTPWYLHKAFAIGKAPRISDQAFADLQRRALLKGINLRRSESFGHVRIWVGHRELLNIDDLEAVVNAAAPSWEAQPQRARAKPAPAPSVRALEDEQRLREARLRLGAAAISGSIAGMVAGARVGTNLLEGIETLVAAEKVHGADSVRSAVHASQAIKKAMR